MSAVTDLLMARSVEDLIPGDPAAAEGFGLLLRDKAQRLGDAARDLTGARWTWQGEAANAAATRKAKLTETWKAAATSLLKSSQAMLAYADALTTARQAAAAASQQFEEGMTQAAQAHARAWLESLEGQLFTDPPTYLPPSRATLATLAAGKGLRDSACSQLDSARNRVRTAAKVATTTLNDSNPHEVSPIPGIGTSPIPPASPNPDPDRFGKYIPFSDPIPLDDISLKSTHIRQGRIDDCWFLSALGSVSNADPNWIRNHLRRNPNGSYTVTLYDPSIDPASPSKKFRAVDITVEPSVVEGGAKDAAGNPNFASIYEKALATHRARYSNIENRNSRDGLEIITGRPAEHEEDKSLAAIKDGLDSGRIYVAGTENRHTGWNLIDDEVDDERIVPDHSYVIDKVEQRDGEMKIHLRNPWGPAGGEDHGTYKDGDLWLSEAEFHDNFFQTASVSR